MYRTCALFIAALPTAFKSRPSNLNVINASHSRKSTSSASIKANIMDLEMGIKPVQTNSTTTNASKGLECSPGIIVNWKFQTTRTATTTTTTSKRPLGGIIYDMDGTLTKDGAIDFKEMRRRANIPTGADILAHVNSLTDPIEKQKAEQAIHEVEVEAHERMMIAEGCVEMLQYCKSKGLKLAILTRNTDLGVSQFLNRFALVEYFSPAISRNFQGRPKPSPDAIFHICRDHWKLPESQVLMVGDWIDDVETGVAAGSSTCLIKFPKNQHAWHQPDFAIDRLSDIPTLIENYFCVSSQ